jgi:hypothetical protein
MHVSILSIGSFSGRLLSGTFYCRRMIILNSVSSQIPGVGSDFIVKVLHSSRVWCLIVASAIFLGAQVCALYIENPHLLGFVSGLTGLAYGCLFGVFPSIIAEAFGVHGLSQNWGFLMSEFPAMRFCLPIAKEAINMESGVLMLTEYELVSPVVSGNVFNLFYGTVYDSHSIRDSTGAMVCLEGPICYRAAYFVTLGACGLSIILTFWVINHQYRQRLKDDGKAIAGD